MNLRAVGYALLSAALFGLSTPVAKFLLGELSPPMLAGLLYLGAGAGLAVTRRLARRMSGGAMREAPLARDDYPWLAAAVVAGGIAGPLLLMTGLSATAASTASLLLTLEGVLTALIAWFVFRENFDRRIAVGMLCLAAGAVVLSWTGQPTLASYFGPIAVVGACAAWGLDNNFTRKISLADPLQIVEIKGLVAGPVNISIAVWSGSAWPELAPALTAAVIGYFGYGVSLALFVVAMRHLGAARTGAYFSIAPFIGSVAAVAVLAEPLTVQLGAAGALMAMGVWLHLTERHHHLHTHEPMAHTHAHVHDEHHRHRHGPDDPPGEPHTHYHAHERMTHDHPHVPDMHHRHDHKTA